MHFPPSPQQGAARAGAPPRQRIAAILRGLVAVSLAITGIGALHSAHAQQAARTAAELHPSRALWQDIAGTPAATSPSGTRVAIQPFRYRTATLDSASMKSLAAAAPLERSTAARQNPLVVSLPDPAGGFQRFQLVDSPIMEPGLAAKHPEIKTYAGKGVDDPTATIRVSITPLGFNASVRSQKGAWYIDPYYQRDDSLYVSYYTRDYPNRRGRLSEAVLAEPQVSLSRGLFRAGESVDVRGVGFAPGAQVTVSVRNVTQDQFARQTVFATASREGVIAAKVVADPYKTPGTYEVTVSDGQTSATGTYQVVRDGVSTNASVGSQLRTYRLALLSDPGYATYFGGSANVTAAKVVLINRVTQIYEDETSIRLVLIANNDALNLDTAAQFSGTNGPCGGTACYPAASVSCSSSTLTRTRLVIGLLVGASNFDIGHIGVGAGGGGIASLGVVGGNNKAQGCTGLPTPVGDLFAVDYVAHEMGHQFAGNHTFNGVVGSCSGGNRSAANSVEPGSGSSIMAYAGICGTDDSQPHSDPYWSQRSFDEITTYTSAAETSINEVQYAVLSGFGTNGLQFQLRYNGADSAPIVRGTNFTTTGVKAAVEAIAGWPVGGTVTISTLGDTAFTITFGGTLAGVNTGMLELVNPSAGVTGKVGEIAKGGTTTRGGTVTPKANSAPVVAPLANYTIPLRTPFALTASATDADGDTITYLWEQNDRGGATGTGLTSNTKVDGPLFRQFGTRADVSAANTLLYNSPGENAVTTNPKRVFPDLPQILANNTNAETGTCSLAGATPTALEVDCFSEFLPTAAYTGFAGVNASPASLNFKVTARDGKGGVNSAATQLVLAAGTGPFLVTSPNTAVTLRGGLTQAIAWNVAGTDANGINTANVKISLSTDGGKTFPTVLAASTPNTGTAFVFMPRFIYSTTARVKIEAISNVFFDVSNVNFTLLMQGDVDGDGGIGCTDVNIIRANFGLTNFDPRADINGDGRVNFRDLDYVTQRIRDSTCPQ